MTEDGTRTRRLFIGLIPCAQVRARLAALQRQWFWPPGSRPTRPERLHLTMHFLGDVDADREALLRAALADVDVEPLDLVLRTPECWSGGIAVVRPDADVALRALHARIAHAVAAGGLRPARERAWTPHVTLARDAHGAAPPEGPRPIRWRVPGFALVWSRLTPPLGYTTVEQYRGRRA